MLRPGLRIDRLVKNVAKLAKRDILEPFSAAIELLVDLRRGFLHDFVRILRSAAQYEVLAARDPGLTIVGVEGNT